MYTMVCCIYKHWWRRGLFIWQLPASFGADCSSIQWGKDSRKEICFNKIRRMDQDQWKQDTTPNVDEVSLTCNNEDFTLNFSIIAPTEKESMQIASRYISFHKLIEHLLLRFNNTVAGKQLFWEWEVTKMRSYMKFLVIMHHGCKPRQKHFDPCWQIKVSNIACFYHGVTMTWIFSKTMLWLTA